MPATADRDRLTQDRLHSRITDLWLALAATRSVVGFMQSGAHPDDETSAMLAALRFRDGLSTSYVCSTRGEGGQNDIGAETVRDLGTLRTAEMERAAEALDLRMWWLSEGPEDAIFDFGFSKSGTDTLARWGRDRTLARFVDVVRQERPDILVPTFLDVGGQHGHHRAMTALAHEVMDAAADPAFIGSDHAPWQVAKLYLPGWGGGGGSYDDDEPPPPASITVPGKGADPVTGWSWENMAQGSRASHRTQGMGRWISTTDQRDWPLHLADSRVGPDRAAVTDNLPLTLTDLGLDAAQGAIDAARAAFPDFAAVAAKTARALADLDGARVAPEHAHRVARKRRELARVLRLAAGVRLDAWTDATALAPGERTRLHVDLDPGAAAVDWAPLLAQGWHRDGDDLLVDAAAPPSDPYPVAYDPLDPPRPAIALRLTVAGQSADCRLPLHAPPQIRPVPSAVLRPEGMVLNLALPPADLTLRLTGVRPQGATPRLDLPGGWRQDWQGATAMLAPPRTPAEGLVRIPLTLDGTPALSETSFPHGHVAPRLRAFPAVLRLRTLTADLPPGRVGYAGGGNDRVGAWMTALGLAVTDLTDAALADEDALAGLSALIVGVFAFRRPGLAAARARIRAWIEAGGTLVTLYHRPGDGWDGGATPPRRIDIGTPSLRWRVTDAAAEVTVLAPDHPVLTTPNRIGPDDWDGWQKERGLYFARAWDRVYTPLVAIADAGEAPLQGALLSAEIGRGRHSHVALGLHHQMAELVPGAFRLMANLVAAR